MSLIVSSYGVADCHIQHVGLRQLVGSYELTFLIDIKLLQQTQQRLSAIVYGADIAIKTASGQGRSLGWAQLPVPLKVGPWPNLSAPQVSMRLVLQPGQLEKIEEFRNADDLSFELALSAEGTANGVPMSLYERWTTKVARSDWIDRLRSASAMDILIVEIPFPPSALSSDEARAICDDFRIAQRHFYSGNFQDCISACRRVIDGATTMLYGSGWTAALWRTFKRNLATRGESLQKVEREQAIAFSLRHYAHTAHHAVVDGGGTDYTRSEAKYLLTSTAALLERICRARMD